MIITVGNRDYTICHKIFNEDGNGSATIKVDASLPTYENVLDEFFSAENLVVQTDRNYYLIIEDGRYLHDTSMQTKRDELVAGRRVIPHKSIGFRVRKFGEYDLRDFPTMKRFQSDTIRMMPLSQTRNEGMVVLIDLPEPVGKEMSRTFKLHSFTC